MDSASRIAQKRPADGNATNPRLAQRPRLVAQNGFPPTAKVQLRQHAVLQHSYFATRLMLLQLPCMT